jgi:outer membrane protein TolC
MAGYMQETADVFYRGKDSYMKNRLTVCSTGILLLFGIVQVNADTPFTLESAVTYALAHNADVLLETAGVSVARGELKAAAAPTDVTVGASAGYENSVTPVDSDNAYSSWFSDSSGSTILKESSSTGTLDTSFWLQKLFSFGLQSKLSFDLQRSDTDYHYSKGENYMTDLDEYYESYAYPDATNYSTVKLSLSLPLFKSFSSSLQQKNMNSARYYLEQQQYVLSDTIARNIIAVCDAYWQYANAFVEYQAKNDSNERLKKQKDNLLKLIDAGISSGTELDQINANIAANTADIMDAQNAIEQKRSDLEEVMGVPSSERNQFERASDTFPDIGDRKGASLADDLRIHYTIKDIIAMRPDIQVLKRKVDNAREQLAIKEINIRPDCDLNFSLGYTGTKYGNSAADYFSSIHDNVRGTNYGGSISFSMSFPDNKTGSVDAARGTLKQVEIVYDKKVSMLESDINSSIRDMEKYHNILVSMNTAVQLYKKLIKDQQERFDEGLITVDALNDIEEKSVSTRIQYYNYYRLYLNTVLQFKYYTNTLVGLSESRTDSFRTADLYSIAY